MDLLKITKNLRTININETQDNLTSSRDSINAIPPSDIEQLETDVEDNINRIKVPFTEQSYRTESHNQLVAADMEVGPVINSQTCFVSGNNNMILNHLNDNFAFTDTNKNAAVTATVTANNKNKSNACNSSSVKKSRNKDLEKRKLSQNLDNFSLRLGHNVETDNQKKSNEKVIQTKKEPEHSLSDSKNNNMKNSNQSGEEKQSVEYVN